MWEVASVTQWVAGFHLPLDGPCRVEGAALAEKTEKGIVPAQAFRRLWLWHACILLCFSFQGRGVNLLLLKIFPLG